MAPEKIYKEINLPLLRSWGYGEQRCTPKGRILEGFQKDTYCCFKVASGKGLSETLLELYDFLIEREKFIREIVSTEGTVECYVTLSVGNGEIFPANLMLNLGSLGVDLAIEIN